MILCSN